MSLELIKKIRAESGAGMVDVKKALDEAGGDEAKAMELLKERGLQIAAKKQDRETNEGLVASYIHGPGKMGALIKLVCETDFVARNEEFPELAKIIAQQVTAMNPVVVNEEDLTEDIINAEKDSYKEENPEGDVDAHIEEWKKTAVLMNQSCIMDDSKTIGDLITEKTAKLGEKISVKEFCRFAL